MRVPIWCTLLLPLLAFSADLKVQVKEDISYRPGNPLWTLDLYTPSGPAAKRPAVVLIHGGGWRTGDKRGGGMKNEAEHLAERGYVAASVDYRLVKQGVLLADCIQDVKNAVRWLRANAGQYGIDTDHIGATGASAGGHLALVLGVSGGVAELEGDGTHRDQSSRVQAVVSFAGPVTLEKLPAETRVPGEHPFRILFNGTPDQKPEAWKLASPARLVTKDDAPLLMVQGMLDETVPTDQPDALLAAYRDAGLDAAVLKVSLAGHGVMGSKQAPVRAAVDAFWDQHLRR
jgi:acetyl esterase/lipase